MKLPRFHNTFRVRQQDGFIAFVVYLTAVFALVLLLPGLASAYTVVMRGGHRIEIPDRFEITGTALTYEAAPGLLVTLQLSSIDIAATDRANGSPEGTLLRRTGKKYVTRDNPVLKSTSRAVRTLTNSDLEQLRRTRIESEAAYDRRRKELGLPSREESERRRLEESVRARELLGDVETEQHQAENYWRARASGIRNEIYVLDSELSYVRARVAETESTYTVGFATIGGHFPFSGFGTTAPQPIAVNQYHSNANRRRRQYPNFVAPWAQPFAVTYPYSFNSYERSALVLRLRELEATRAGLLARWRLLEDEARRAGAQPGWLRQ